MSLDNRVRKIVIQRLESLQQAGVTHLPMLPAPGQLGAGEAVGRPAADRPAAGQAEPIGATTVASAHGTPTMVCPHEGKTAHLPQGNVRAPASGAAQQDMQAPGPTVGLAKDDPRVLALGELARRVADCTRCAELVGYRTQTVFGVGNPYARLVFVGEAPGEDEDWQGEPFVGAAGQLLNRILAACGLRREDVYIMNILRCRPPGNRTPSPEEAENCREFLEGQLEIIRPEFICCLGACAAQNLLQTRTPIGKLRGKIHQYRGAKVVCTFHPAYLLRNPAAKKDCWKDMKLLMAEMGIQLPER